MADDEKRLGFVSLKSLTKGRPDPAAAIAEIRRIYFRTSRRTIEHDFVQAIDLLKSLPSEEERDRAAVYMEGLAQMRRDWQRKEVKNRKSKEDRKPKVDGSSKTPK